MAIGSRYNGSPFACLFVILVAFCAFARELYYKKKSSVKQCNFKGYKRMERMKKKKEDRRDKEAKREQEEISKRMRREREKKKKHRIRKRV